MKFSLAWIFDYIDADWKRVDVAKLSEKITRTTAEVESFDKVEPISDAIQLARVEAASGDSISVVVPETKKKFELPKRDDAVEGGLFFVKVDGAEAQWCSIMDWCPESAKDGLVPRVQCEDSLLGGKWRRSLEADDYIFEIDNKSMTHRPDLWGHRGMAREVATLLDLKMLPDEKFLKEMPVVEHDSSCGPTSGDPFSVSIVDKERCKKFSYSYAAKVVAEPAIIWVADRLIKVGTRPLSALIDATNYVMFDVGQPMHVFDSAKIGKEQVKIRHADKGEKILLLDGDEVELTKEDLVVADAKKPIALAGIMGGEHSGVTPETTSIFIEAACFDATSVRKTSVRTGKRSEASGRFEKSLDPSLNVLAIKRMLKHLSDCGINLDVAPEIVSLGILPDQKVVTISHDFLNRKLGVEIPKSFVSKALSKIGFSVVEKPGDVFEIEVPSYRATKDISIKEDIAEEIGRLYGLDKISPDLPSMKMEPRDLSSVLRPREIKRFLAYGLHMQEVGNYSFYDEDFLRRIDWDPGKLIELKDPISENRQRLISSLVPHLLCNVEKNSHNNSVLRLFEVGPVWSLDKKAKEHGGMLEKKSLAGVMYDRGSKVAFYDGKRLVTRLMDVLGVTAEWRRVDNPAQPWFRPHETAELIVDGSTIGVAGCINHAVMEKVAEGDAFVFEFDADFLFAFKPGLHAFSQLPKYQDVSLDVSLLVSPELSTAQLEKTIVAADSRITSVRLIDMFEKAEWQGKRSLTFRFNVRDLEKTMSGSDIESVQSKVTSAVEKLGAKCR